MIGSPEQVTSAWLTQVINATGIDATVASFSAANIGTGQVGQNVRFKLRYSSGSGPASVVGKFPSNDPTSRATGIAQGNYVKEVHFYKNVKPRVAIQTPNVLHVDIDEESGEFCLLMEDLAPAVQGDQLGGCDADAARLAVKEAAKLHGPTWRAADLTDDEILNPNVTANAGIRDLWTLVHPGFVARYSHRMHARHLALLERFTQRLEAYVEPPNDNFCLIHGDYRLDNMMFGGPYPLAVVDWQTPSVGHPLSDVAYFIGAGLLPVLRRELEATLVRDYHNALLDQGIEGYDFETCFDDYRRYSFSGLVMAVIASMIVGQTDRGDDMFMAMASRHADQALDLDAESLLV